MTQSSEMNIRMATADDEDFLIANQRHISAELMKEKIARREVYVAEVDGQILGWARYGLFWDNLPFLNMIYVSENHRQSGIGSALMRVWECDMAESGHSLVLTSTLSNEDAQHFYRKLGYRDCGSLFLPGEAEELFLMKKLDPAK